MCDKDSEKVEQLYSGDKRLDNLEEAIEELIYDRVGGSTVPVVSVMGVLQRLVFKFNATLDD